MEQNERRRDRKIGFFVGGFEETDAISPIFVPRDLSSPASLPFNTTIPHFRRLSSVRLC